MSVLNWFPVTPRSSSKPRNLTALASGQLSYTTKGNLERHVRCITTVHTIHDVNQNQEVQLTEKPSSP